MSEVATARGRRSRQRLVEAAAGLFAQRGVNGTSLDDVLAVAGASKSQLYHYFANKQALVVAVIEHHGEVVMAANAAAIDGARTLEDVGRWFDGLVAFQEHAGFHGGCPVGSVAAELADADEPARVAAATCFASWRGRIAQTYRRMRADGALRPDADVDALALSTLAAIEGGLLLSKSERSTASLRAVLDATLSHLRSWAGDGAVPPPTPGHHP